MTEAEQMLAMERMTVALLEAIRSDPDCGSLQIAMGAVGTVMGMIALVSGMPDPVLKKMSEVARLVVKVSPDEAAKMEAILRG